MLRQRAWRLWTLIFALALACPAAGQQKPGKATLDTKKLSQIHGEAVAGAAKPGDDLQRLLAERLAVAGRAYRATVKNYENGLASTEDVIRASRRLAAAELGTKLTREERIAALEKAVALEKEFVQLTERQVQGGAAAPVVLENARYDLLTAQIKLLRAKAGSKTPK
jgi:hypothetical protein